MLNRITVLLASTLLTSHAFADWSFQPKIGLEAKSYTLTINDTYKGTSDTGGPVLGISAVNSSGWFIDIENSFGEDPIEGLFSTEAEPMMERNDTSISIGKSTDGFVIFAGYKITESEVSCDDCFSLGETHPVLSTDFKFVTTGFFLGLANTFTLAPSHFANISIAGGVMDGEYNPEGADSGSNTSVGYSATASYIYSINKKWTFSSGIKTQAYTYDELSDDPASVTSAAEEFTTFFLKAGYKL